MTPDPLPLQLPITPHLPALLTRSPPTLQFCSPIAQQADSCLKASSNQPDCFFFVCGSFISPPAISDFLLAGILEKKALGEERWLH